MDFFLLLLVSFLFGGMLLFSVGFGTLSFKLLQPEVARKFIRKTFPYFYGYVFCASALICLISINISTTIFSVGLVICVTTVPTALLIMPAINKASDKKQRKNFIMLHTMSVLITILHIIGCAALLYLILEK